MKYSQVIFTKSDKGIDSLKEKNPIASGSRGGFKIYSYSENIAENVDIDFLDDIVERKESCSDPDFMEEAYLFVIPDKGKRFLMNFKPILGNISIKNGYKPGNYVNQIFVGLFEDIYPYETFGVDMLWDAKRKDETYYCNVDPVPLELRELSNVVGDINFETIAEFVKNGRREVLKNAIAFIIEQYSLNSENRKYLVIKDENSENIEFWIAAIENAFSPRMASGLSFATRMDDFETSNKYMVSSSGKYLGKEYNSNSKLHYQAMIVGVDEHDVSNFSKVKSMPNASYIVLDGKSKTLSVSVDTSNPYFDFVTSYDDADKHRKFCKNFLQMMNIKQPTKDVLELYYAYRNWSVSKLSEIIKIIDLEKINKTQYFVEIYKWIRKNLSECLKLDVVSAFSIFGWVKKAAGLVGDNEIENYLVQTVCDEYLENFLNNPKSETTQKLYNEIQKNDFIKNIAASFETETFIIQYGDILRGYDTATWKAFSEFFQNYLQYYEKGFPNSVKTILSICIRRLYKDKKYSEMSLQEISEIISFYASKKAEQTFIVLLSEVENHPFEEEYIEFIIELMLNLFPEKIEEKNLMQFYKQFKAYKLDKEFRFVLKIKAKKIANGDVKGIEKFVKLIEDNQEFLNQDLSDVFEILDGKLAEIISEKSSEKVAEKIQLLNKEKVNCPNSANIYALYVISDKKQKDNVCEILKDLSSQGFPLENDKYAAKFVDIICSPKLPYEVFKIVLGIIYNFSFYSEKVVNKIFDHKNSELVGRLIETASNLTPLLFENDELYESLVEKCSKLKKFEKDVSLIKSTLQTKSAKEYFARIEDEAKNKREQTKQPSFFKRLLAHKVHLCIIAVTIVMLCGVLVFLSDKHHNARKKSDDNLLSEAIQKNDVKKISKLIAEKTDVNYIDSDGWTPLLYAIINNRINIISLLINNNADPNLESKDWTPLKFAIDINNRNIILTLINCGANPNYFDSNEFTPLKYAICKNNKELVKLLLSNGADVNYIDPAGWTPLSYAKDIRNMEMYNLLIEQGAVNLDNPVFENESSTESENRDEELEDFYYSPMADIN